MSNDLAHVLDMLKSAEAITRFVDGTSEQTFLTDLEKQSAVMYQFAVLGESANRVSKAFEASHPEIAWGDVVGFRNVLIHQYHSVDLAIVWETVTNRLPALIAQLRLIAPANPNA